VTQVRQARGRKAHARGHFAEHLAEISLRLKGYRILSRRYRTPVGEVDLVVRKGSVLAFVEVKGRDNLTSGLDAVTQKTQMRISRAAEHFAASHPDIAGTDWRFDVVVVTGLAWPRHFRNAF
jgi:putative endonuclease